MTKLNKSITILKNDIDFGKYQNDNKNELLKSDLDVIYANVLKDEENQAEYIGDLENEIQELSALLSKFGKGVQNG